MDLRYILLFGLLLFYGCLDTPTCSDGLLNQGESGVDCGGPCPACAPSTTTTTLPDCGGLSKAEKDMCHYSNAEKSLNPTECMLIEDDFLEADCLIGVANQKGDANLCSRVEIDLSRDECYKNIAAKQNKPKICAHINNSAHKDSCYYNIAIEAGNTTLCGLVNSDTTRLRCLAIRNRDSSICMDITSVKARDWCLFKVVDVAPENEVCNLINTTATAEQCFSILAKAKADESICRRHTTQYREECIAGVAEAKKRLQELNKKLNGSEWKIQPKY